MENKILVENEIECIENLVFVYRILSAHDDKNRLYDLLEELKKVLYYYNLTALKFNLVKK
jgi:hypothetical protein